MMLSPSADKVIFDAMKRIKCAAIRMSTVEALAYLALSRKYPGLVTKQTIDVARATLGRKV